MFFWDNLIVRHAPWLAYAPHLFHMCFYMLPPAKNARFLFLSFFTYSSYPAFKTGLARLKPGLWGLPRAWQRCPLHVFLAAYSLEHTVRILLPPPCVPHTRLRWRLCWVRLVWDQSHIGTVPGRLVKMNETLLLRTRSFRLLIWEEKTISQVLTA